MGHKVAIYKSERASGVQSWVPVLIPRRKADGGLFLKDNVQAEYHLSWYEGKSSTTGLARKRFKKVAGSVSVDGFENLPYLSEAIAAKEAKEWELQHPERVKPEEDRVGRRRTLASAVFAYFDRQPNDLNEALRGKDSSLKEHKHALKEFQAYTRSVYVDQMNWKELERWKHDLQAGGNDEVTAVWKLIRVNKFFKWAMNRKAGEGLFKTTIFKDVLNKEPIIEVYTEEEIQVFFAACDAVDGVLFRLYYKCGLRNKELAHLEWTDLNLDRRTVSIRSKKMRNGDKKKDWGPKHGSEGDVPLPIEIIEPLKKMRAQSKCNLVFPTRNGKVNIKLLDKCKAIAKRAGLNNWKEFKVKSFRSTYATNRLRTWNGDIPTVRKQLRHKDAKSIEHYLKWMETQQLIESGKVDVGWAV